MKSVKCWMSWAGVAGFWLGFVSLARADEIVNGVTWYCNITGNEAEIVYADPAVGELEIPPKLDGYAVTSIKKYAFAECYDLTSITMPDSVTNIGEGAFLYCENLTNVRFPSGMTYIGLGAFEGCIRLSNISIPDGLSSLGMEVFSFCESLENVTIPDGITSIDTRAFYRCSNLVSVKLPDSVNLIKWDAFYDCNSLATIYAPASWEGNMSVLDDIWYPLECQIIYYEPDLPTSQTIDFTPIGNQVATNTVTLSATASSGLGVSFAVASGPADLNGTMLTFTGAGEVTITATQAGNESYASATVSQTFTVTKASQSIAFEAIPGQSVGNTVTLLATASSELDVSFTVSGPATLNGNVLACTGAGTISVTASQNGNDLYAAAAPVTQEFSVSPVETSTAPVAVPWSWLKENAAGILEENGGDYEAAALAEAANGRAVWECYLTGVSPTVPKQFFSASLEYGEDGKLTVKWTPDLNEDGTKNERLYWVKAKKDVLDEEWADVTDVEDLEAEGWNFFRVGVKMP